MTLFILAGWWSPPRDPLTPAFGVAEVITPFLVVLKYGVPNNEAKPIPPMPRAVLPRKALLLSCRERSSIIFFSLMISCG